MNRRFLGWMTLAILAATPAAALMTVETISGRYSPVSRTPHTDTSLQELGNAPGRVAGERTFFSGIGMTERLFFAGDEFARDAFVRKYGSLKGRPLVIWVHHEAERPQPDRALRPRACEVCEHDPEPPPVRYDWMLTRHLPWDPKQPETLTLDVWVGADLPWNSVAAPWTVTVKQAKPGP